MLEEITNSPKCFVHIPFFWLLDLIKWESFVNAQAVLMDPHQKMYWQHFEQFGADFQALRANALLQHHGSKQVQFGSSFSN
ncbi:MAG: hypothetical protein ACYCT1_19955 [Steroidobacteraceae bacterium]